MCKRNQHSFLGRKRLFHASSRQKGFTLVELMIVVAIVGILSAIGIGQFVEFRIKAFHSAANADMKNLKTSLEAYYSDNYQYLNPADF